jgi:hypothetical protein
LGLACAFDASALAGVSAGIVAFSLVEFANINIYESAAILMPVVTVSALGGTLMLLIALRRST